MSLWQFLPGQVRNQLHTFLLFWSMILISTIAFHPGVPLHLTVSAMLNQDEDGEDPNGAFRARQKAMRFVRKVLALLVLQYLSILIIVAPFCLLDDIQEVLLQHPIFSVFIGLGSFLGLVFAIYLVAYKGHIRRYAKIALCLGTSSFALALGSKLALVHWSNYALIAIAQATVNFSVLHALVQLDDHFPRVQHLQKGGAVWLGLVMAFLWIMVMREAGARWLVAATVPIGGWLYFCSVIRSVGRTMCHREPWDYLRAVIFILGPNVPDRWLFSLRRTTAKGRWTAIQSGVHLQGNISNKKRPNGMKEQKQKQKLSQQQEDSPLVATAGSYGGMENGTIIRV